MNSRKRQISLIKLLCISWLLAICFQAAASDDEFEFKEARLNLAGKSLLLEFADTWELRAQGLQFRKILCPDCGMLFRFEKQRFVSMWMKNTLLPLDVAFIDKKGVIIDIKAMQPLDLTSVPSSMPVLYALEMNQGWFAENGIEEGQTIENLP